MIKNTFNKQVLKCDTGRIVMETTYTTTEDLFVGKDACKLFFHCFKLIMKKLLKIRQYLFMWINL